MIKKQSGYEGRDSMREKAERLFGDAIKTSMADVPSASAPSKTPMRKYAKGGSVMPGVKKGAYEHTGTATGSRVGALMPKNAKEPVEDADLTDLHMPKKMQGAQYKAGGKAKVTSNLRQALRGKVKVEPRGEERDVGSIKQIPDRKQKTMLHPKPASMGNKHSKLNVESMAKMNKLKHGGRTPKCKK